LQRWGLTNVSVLAGLTHPSAPLERGIARGWAFFNSPLERGCGWPM